MSIDCHVRLADGCIVCPTIPTIPRRPGRFDSSGNFGWNAGANLVADVDGNLHLLFQMPAGALGVIVGFKTSREFQDVPQLVQFGLYFAPVGSQDSVRIVESGVYRTPYVSRSGSDTFELRRVNGVVSYFNGSTLLYRSQVPSSGRLYVNSCVYASGVAVT